MARLNWERANRAEAAARNGSRDHSLEAKANAILGRAVFFGSRKMKSTRAAKNAKNAIKTRPLIEVNGKKYIDSQDGTLRLVSTPSYITHNQVIYVETDDGTLVPVGTSP
jgi:hypothetical protein